MLLFIDIETIPGPTRPELHEVKVDARLKDPEKIATAQREGIEESYRKQALDSMAGRIWCIGTAINGEPASVDVSDDEYALVKNLDALVASAMSGDKFAGIEFIGHNAMMFDMKWLWRRAVKYRLGALAHAINFDRYRGNISDTMTMWGCGDNRDYVSLDKLAAYLGVGGKTPGMDGSKVYDLWQSGDTDAVIEYCKRDVELTRDVYHKLISI